LTLDLTDVPADLRQPIGEALAAAGVEDGHLSVELVSEAKIQTLNREHRGRDQATDVLAFPLDGPESVAGPRELGDVVICGAVAESVTEAAVHGALHLCGLDHEADSGEMLTLQGEVMARIGTGELPSAERQAGFIGLAGRPNVGKSTLANAIVGQKIAIVSDRPQTTRRAVRGVATDLDAGWQMVLVDLPGVQRPRDALTERMQRRVERELADSDAVLIVLDGPAGVGPGDRFIAKTLLGTGPELPVICAVNKCDLLTPAQTTEVLAGAAELGVVDDVFPVSAKEGTGLEQLVSHLADLLPPGPFLYAAEDRSDQPSHVHLAELVREQILRRTRDEVPHAVEVQVQEIEQRDDGLIEVRAQIWVERESQKGILIGKGGKMVREVGTAARQELERELDTQVYLDLSVQVRPSWRRDDALLDRLGIE
jgi:GTP-binding protein Era